VLQELYPAAKGTGTAKLQKLQGEHHPDGNMLHGFVVFRWVDDDFLVAHLEHGRLAMTHEEHAPTYIG